MVKYTKVLTRKTATAISTTLIVAMILISTTMPVLGATYSDTVNNEGWAKIAAWALRRARRAMGYAIDKIVEEAQLGKDVSLAKNTLKASMIIYGAAERTFGKGHYRKAFFTAVLSALVARDSARIAVEGLETVDVVMNEVEQELEQVKAFIDELEESGVDVSLARNVLVFAEKLHTKAQELASEKPVKALVAVEVSRILAHVAQIIAQTSQ